MTDATTQKPLRVLIPKDAGPYIWLPAAQVDEVSALLRANGVPHWLDRFAISFEGGPETTVINLGRRVDGAAVQRILDNIPDAHADTRPTPTIVDSRHVAQLGK